MPRLRCFPGQRLWRSPAAAHPNFSPHPNNPNASPPFTRCDWSCRHSRGPSESSVRSEIFVAPRIENSPAPSRLHSISARRAGRNMPLLTELEFLFSARTTTMPPRWGWRTQLNTVKPYSSNCSSAVTTVRSFNFAVAMMNRSQGSSWIRGSSAAAMQTFNSNGSTVRP